MRGRKILITGGTKGLGLATAKILTKSDSELFLSYRNDQANAEKVAEEIGKHCADCTVIQCDLSELDAIHKLFDVVEAKTSLLDIYIHNAAATAFKPLMEIKSHHIDKTFNISIKSFIQGTQRAAKMMTNGGVIIPISGMDNLKMIPGHGLLGAAKSALETLTAYFAHELAEKKIRVNCINPGFFTSESTQKFLGDCFTEVKKYFTELSPLHRESTLEDFARVIQFLASEESDWIVGQTIRVDGGQHFAFPLKI